MNQPVVGDGAYAQVEVYTDGGCDPNPGPGGWGAILVYGVSTKELSGAEPQTTNNRMELTAALSALRALKRPCQVTLWTDSQYLRQGITEWLADWAARGWRRADGSPVQNADLWQQLATEAQRHRVAWQWVKGHRGNPLNERADHLATAARQALAGAGRPQESDEDGHPLLGAPAVGDIGRMPRVSIYTAGCALAVAGRGGEAGANTLRGGYAAVLLYETGRVEEVRGRRPQATSNLMELAAAIAGLRALRVPSRVTLHGSAKYVLEGATRWLATWERNGWRTQQGQPVRHRESWQELIAALGDHDVTWKHLSSSRDANARRAQAAARGAAEELL